jgi:hypothetical protein
MVWWIWCSSWKAYASTFRITSQMRYVNLKETWVIVSEPGHAADICGICESWPTAPFWLHQKYLFVLSCVLHQVMFSSHMAHFNSIMSCPVSFRNLNLVSQCVNRYARQICENIFEINVYVAVWWRRYTRHLFNLSLARRNNYENLVCHGANTCSPEGKQIKSEIKPVTSRKKHVIVEKVPLTESVFYAYTLTQEARRYTMTRPQII